jgi:hypothetical protein
MRSRTRSRTGKNIDSGGEYFEGDKSYQVVSLSINVLKRKFGFFLDRPCIMEWHRTASTKKARNIPPTGTIMGRVFWDDKG